MREPEEDDDFDVPDPLDDGVVELIRREIGEEKAEWARKILNIQTTAGLVLTPGLWLRYPNDPKSRVRVEVVEVSDLTCQVWTHGFLSPTTFATRTLLRYRTTIPPKMKRPWPAWLRPGAQFIETYSSREHLRWIVITVNGGLCSTRHVDNGTFLTWRTEELFKEWIVPVLTSWERLDEELV